MPDDPFHHALETTSPWTRTVRTRERARRTVGVEGYAHRVASALFNRVGTLEVVERRRSDERPHQSLRYHTPAEIYLEGMKPDDPIPSFSRENTYTGKEIA